MPRNQTEGASARKLETLVELARQRGSGEVDESVHLAGRTRFLAAVEKERTQGASRVVALRTAYAIAAAVVITVGTWGVERYRTPEWRVDGAVAQGEGFIRADAAHEATIHYADGSDVVLAPASRARVTKGDAHHVVLEEGRVEVRIAHGARLAFAFDAGPFTVRAAQGALAVGWTGSDESLEVAPHEGSAIVQGGIAGAGITVSTGDHLSAKARAGELKMVRADGAIATAIAPAPPAPVETALPDDAPPSPIPSSTSAPTSTSAPSTPSGAPHTSWSALVARGEYGSVLHDADAIGIDAALAHKSLGEIVALADASRYESRTDVAKRALLTERTRFAGSKEARTAAFLLGRLADDQAHSPAQAIPWYDRYLTEAPTGPFASDALGRKMVAVRSTRGADAARPIAEEYARRFPRGAYATVAGELMKQ